MSTLTFADTHNMVAFLEKPAESDGFHEIIDFLNGNQIRYALTIQALTDKKKVIIKETSIRSDFHLEDAGGTDCLPTATIFEELARMGKDNTVTQEETQQDDSVLAPSNDPPLSGFNRLRKVGKSSRVESSNEKDSLGDHEDASKQGRSIENIDKDVDVSLVDDTQGRSDNEEMFDTNDLHGDELDVDMPVGEKQEQSAKEREVDTSVEDIAAHTTIKEITLA
ncbi:hypothetical protein Tco_1119612 [Tanacetum coccineum]